MSIFQSREKDGTVSVRVCGYLARDPYVPESGKVVLFTVCYGKGKYMDVKCWGGDNPVGQFASCLEKSDSVAVDGTYEHYTDKDGKQRDQILADHIAVQQTVQPDELHNTEPGGEDLPDGFHEEEEDGQLPF